MFSPVFAIILAVAVLWTTVFSLTMRVPLRLLRNLGILACYIAGIVMFFVAGWVKGACTWVLFALIGGLLYVVHDIVVRVKTVSGEKPPVSFSHLLYGLVAWPIMVAEAVENLLALLGVLKTITPADTPPASPEPEILECPHCHVQVQVTERGAQGLTHTLCGNCRQPLVIGYRAVTCPHCQALCSIEEGQDTGRSVCLACGEPLSETSRVIACPQCGTRGVMPAGEPLDDKICPACKHTLNPEMESAQCPHCGLWITPKPAALDHRTPCPWCMQTVDPGFLAAVCPACQQLVAYPLGALIHAIRCAKCDAPLFPPEQTTPTTVSPLALPGSASRRVEAKALIEQVIAGGFRSAVEAAGFTWQGWTAYRYFPDLLQVVQIVKRLKHDKREVPFMVILGFYAPSVAAVMDRFDPAVIRKKRASHVLPAGQLPEGKACQITISLMQLLPACMGKLSGPVHFWSVDPDSLPAVSRILTTAWVHFIQPRMDQLTDLHAADDYLATVMGKAPYFSSDMARLACYYDVNDTARAAEYLRVCLEKDPANRKVLKAWIEQAGLLSHAE